MKLARDEQFRQFVVSRHADLLRTATLLTAGDHQLAEDLVQTTLIRLYVSWTSFLRAENAVAYSRRALVNTLLTEKRRLWRHRERLMPALPEGAVTSPDTGLGTEALHEALGALPPRMRAAVVLRYFHDLSVAETAQVLNCSQGTVKSQTARALDQLRGTLNELDGTTSSATASVHHHSQGGSS